MKILQLLEKELRNEAVTTRKMLALVPEDKYQWRPHVKSMTFQQLAVHLAELPSWLGMILNTAELDFAKNPYSLPDITENKDLLKFFEENQAGALTDLEKAREEQLDETWILRNGDEIYSESSKYEMIRSSLCQITHHRAQLGVYLRLLNIPIPGSYGPSADEMEMEKAGTAA
jgi:uncharacterized damage-inducible protein DinB